MTQIDCLSLRFIYLFYLLTHLYKDKSRFIYLFYLLTHLYKDKSIECSSQNLTNY